MGRGKCGFFSGTKGARKASTAHISIKTQVNSRKPIFSNGHVTVASISARREYFLGKSVAKIEHILHRQGYETIRRSSTHAHSKARIIVTTNPSKDRNITQVQVSPGSKRHGNVPYVKISTSDVGRIKIIGATKQQYKTDGKENAKLLFIRRHK